MLALPKHLAGLLLLAPLTFLATTASAGDDSPLEYAADCYREAVVDFERQVRKTDYVERYDERLVDDLEDSTSGLRSATRHLDRLERLAEKFEETSRLHYRVETTFFSRTLYPPNPVWDRSWDRVTFAYRNLLKELECLQEYFHQRHHRKLERRHGPVHRHRAIPQQYIVPLYGFGQRRPVIEIVGAGL